MKVKAFLVGIIILLAAIWLTYSYVQKTYGKSIHVAFAGPLSGDGATAGKLMSQAIQLYFDEINKKGGINGKKIVLDTFDDKNNAEVAKQQAIKIIEQNKAIAVIGHWYSSASISAGKVYKEYKIPAITPGSTNLAVTQDNEWYFRNIYNATASGKFLANYVKNVFKQNNVTIIREKAAYGSYLAEIFKQESKKLDIVVKNDWQYDNNDKDLSNKFIKIINELKDKDAGIILLAVQATEGVELVKLIKDAGIRNTIIGASSLSEQTFLDGFEHFPIEKEYPGFYINDIYVATPLIFDTANEKAQKFKEDYQTKYQEDADWSAAYAYDSAMLVVEAIKKAKIGIVEQTITEKRQKVRDILASFNNVYAGIKGVTGLNYFDDTRDAQKPVSLGVYKNKRSVSALTQLKPIRSLNEISDLNQARKEDRIISIDNKYMYKTNVVYTGVEFFNITDIDVKNLLATLEFKLWFRFQGDFNPADIEFSNTIEPDKIAEQLKKPIETKTKTKTNITYKVYRIKAKFKTDFISDYYLFRQHILGISFRHHSLTRNNLVYVTDILGMGLTSEKELIQRLTKNKIINPISGWLMTRTWFFSQITREYSGGDPDHLNSSDGLIEYSRFNSVIQIKMGQFTLRGMVPYKFSYHLAIISGLLFLLLAIVTNKKQRFSQVVWFFQVLLAFMFLLSAEVIIFSDWLSESSNIHQMELIVRIFGILWWMIPAALINVAAERFIWTPLEEKTGPIPNIIRNFFAMAVYIMAITCIIVFVYEKEFTSLLATSGMLAMIIGLAIQVNISNVFSGIVINMERPFRIGDWVQIAGLEEGEVVDINWRATRIRNRSGCTLSIPNSIASESVILNFHYPDETYWLWPTVYVHPRHHPEKIKQLLLDALLTSDKVLKKPEPMVLFVGINEWSASYWIAFCADNYGDKNFILEDVWNKVWVYLDNANIEPAVMRQEVHVFKGDKKIPTVTEVDVLLPDQKDHRPRR